ncbi:MAG: hypothetical protein ACXIT4_09115 [Erythrobacter sp.]
MGQLPLIPEPMVFDMVRPLGAKRGELEVNTLALFPIRSDGEPVDWAPEIEYAFADGWGIEFELPFENGTLESYKFAVQGTFGGLANNRAIHGFQYFTEIDASTGRLDHTLVYIIGAQYGETWSTLTMVGFNIPSEQPEPGEDRDDAVLINHSFFKELRKNTILGVETNIRAGRDRTSWLVMPQVHQSLTDRLMLQAGMGAQRPRHGGSVHATAGVRLIREF